MRFIQNGSVIYRMDFPIDEPWQFAEFAKVALNDFTAKFPSISLADSSVSMMFVESDDA